MPPKRPSPARLWFKQGLQILRQPGNPCLHIMLICKELFFLSADCLPVNKNPAETKNPQGENLTG